MNGGVVIHVVVNRSVLVGMLILTLAVGAEARADAPKRELPDYDGRGGEPTTAGDVALWVPRTLLFPFYLTSEYVIRRPLGALIAGAERAGVPWVLYDLFTFGPEHKAGIVPTAFVDFGFRPSVGLYSFWDDAFVNGHDLRLTGATWGSDWLAARAIDRVHLSKDPYDVALVSVTAIRRPDHAFFGVGPESREGDLSRFGMDTFQAETGVDLRLWRSSSVHARVGLRRIAFHRGSLGNDAVLDQEIATGTIVSPPGYDQSHTIGQSTTSIAIDTRCVHGPSGSGIRVEGNGTLATDLNRTTTWAKYGGSVVGFLDLNDRGRVVSLSVTPIFTDLLSGGSIPFTELVQLGGFEPMRGYLPGRLVGRSAAVAGLGYRWPVWSFLNGAIHFEVGNVFDDHLHDFRAGLLRFSGSIGVESRGATDNPLQVMFGVGSETFESGAKIDSIRFLVGTTHGF